MPISHVPMTLPERVNVLVPLIVHAEPVLKKVPDLLERLHPRAHLLQEFCVRAVTTDLAVEGAHQGGQYAEGILVRGLKKVVMP